jgi:hypothetical protein
MRLRSTVRYAAGARARRRRRPRAAWRAGIIARVSAACCTSGTGTPETPWEAGERAQPSTGRC